GDPRETLLRRRSIEPGTDIARRLDRLHPLKGLHAPANRRVIAATRRTTDEMTLETPQLSRGGDQPVAKVGIPVQELSTRHCGYVVPWQPPAGSAGPYSSRGSISCAKLLRARLRRLFTVPRLQPVMSAISA